MNYTRIKRIISGDYFDYITICEKRGLVAYFKYPTLMSALKQLITMKKSGYDCEVVMNIEGVYYLHTNKEYKVFATQKEIDHYGKLGQNYVEVDVE